MFKNLKQFLKIFIKIELQRPLLKVQAEVDRLDLHPNLILSVSNCGGK